MTGGRIKRIQNYIDSDIFLVTYGGGVSDVSIADLVAFHKGYGRLFFSDKAASSSEIASVQLLYSQKLTRD